jgi:hypothetical protein
MRSDNVKDKRALLYAPGNKIENLNEPFVALLNLRREPDKRHSRRSAPSRMRRIKGRLEFYAAMVASDNRRAVLPKHGS